MPQSRPWFRAALLAGIGYAAIGITFGLPASHAKAWRLAAWLVSALIFSIHIAREHFKHRQPAGPLARHVGIGVAIGGFLLAFVGAGHSFATTATIRPLWFVALVAWPAITAVPGFVVALVAGMVLGRIAPARQ